MLKWRRNPANTLSVRCLFILAVTITVIFRHIGNEQASNDNYLRHSSRATSRHLLSTAKWEQCDFEIGHSRNYSNPSSWTAPRGATAWVALYVFLIIVVFVALAIICDDFFVPSLEAISEKLDLSEDVAGATFMAAGSSAPELFTSIAGVTVESDVGVGTIVGSAVFNLLGICALSATFAGQVLQLDWRPLSRDSAFYGTSICAFILFAWDGKFEIYESSVMLILYFLYIVLMKFNPELMELMSRCGKKKVNPSVNDNKSSVLQPGSKSETNVETDEDGTSEKTRKFAHINKGTLTKELTKICSSTERNVSVSTLPVITENVKNVDSATIEEDGADGTVVVCPCLPPIQADIPSKHGSGCFSWFRYTLSWLLFVISFPFVVMFTWTIPNCSTSETKKYYLLSFIMSITWIAALSFAMVTLVGRAGCILGVDKFTMGLVVVAIGTSIPDALSSVLVARDGFGDMAVSNAIGSNVFDINLGLGLPFLISSLVRGYKPAMLMTAKQQKLVDEGEMTINPHVKFGFILLIILALSLIVFAYNSFRLTKKLGISFVMLYLVFVAYAYVQDLYCGNSC